jgi:tRNA pseudouridine55 synthase
MLPFNIKTEHDFLAGEFILVDKPLTWTSFDVVNKIRYLLKRKTGVKRIKVGHAGTLDPLATGLLIICTGKFTKRIQEFQDLEKEYTGTFFIGATTPSFDKETDVDEEFPINHISEELLKEATHQFLGNIEQIPPIFSAIKVKGTRAYHMAREKKPIELPARKVQINEFDLTEISLPEVTFRISCSKGTYIRSLARDYGKSLNSGAYLSSLQRTKIGEFSLGNAISISDLEKQLTS